MNKLSETVTNPHHEPLIWKDQQEAVARAHSWGFGWREIIKGWADLKALDLHRYLAGYKAYPPAHRPIRLAALGKIVAVAEGLHGRWCLGFYEGAAYLGSYRTKRGGSWLYGTLDTVAKHAAELGFPTLTIRLPEPGSPEVRTSRKYGTFCIKYPET